MIDFDCIDRNDFLKSLYPNGIDGDILVGLINFDIGNKVDFSLHTRIMPDKPIKKWGEQGVSYNTIVFHFTSNLLKEARVLNPNLFKGCDISFCAEKSRDVVVKAAGENWEFFVKAGGILFDRCTVYMNNSVD